ncbi:MAG: bifunctional NADP-dependent methylenetetrahydromethanopterin dehydrogenase/methylenetetrahydrofolate dehydrogenase [Planctomycetes bacterium]|nr:bifunctional NADP-dependent methylenetetrahydromethanopterin dehydrogenase/methylenetetrahydrofolate dehydrogenase [Planctomycetota bacterium]
MSDKTKILIQLDPDPQASVFDRVVAVDAGAQQVFAYSGVTLEQVQGLVHGAMFTRGPADLAHTAIFIGGSDVAVGEAILKKVVAAFFGPLRVSVMLDANGANTTAAAAVLAARKHLELSKTTAAVLAGTGPVGQRAARLLAREGARVRLCSRTLDRATQATTSVNGAVGGSRVTPHATGDEAALRKAVEGVELVIAAGAAGVVLLPAVVRQSIKSLKVAIDLNAVPPAGIEGVGVMDKAKEQSGVTVYGAIGVGGSKMKIHKAAIASLFEANDRVLDADAIYDLGKAM